MGLGKVLLHPIPALVKVAELLFRLPEILVGRFVVPIKGLLVITLDAHSILEHRAQIVFCERIALLRCRAIVGQSALVIPRHTKLMLIHAAQLSLSGSEALIRGLAIPEESLTVVLGNAVAAIIVIRQGELRLWVSCRGRLAKRIEVVVRPWCRCLARSLDRCLSSRRGKQCKHDASTHRRPPHNTHPS